MRPQPETFRKEMPPVVEVIEVEQPSIYKTITRYADGFTIATTHPLTALPAVFKEADADG